VDAKTVIMKLKITKSNNLTKNDNVVLFSSADDLKKKKNILPVNLKSNLADIDFSSFKSKLGEFFFITLANQPKIVICGLGESKKIDEEALRNCSAGLVNFCRQKNIRNLKLLLPEKLKIEQNDLLRTLSEGLVLANYSFDKYKKKTKSKESSNLSEAIFVSSSINVSIGSKILQEVQVSCSNTNLCRDLINEISLECTPDKFASLARKVSQTSNFSCKIYNKSEIEKMGMGLILAVNRGSQRPPKLLVLKYLGDKKNSKNLAIVGKGITFDSGGMNLKPSGHMETMRMDMAGAATALATIKTAADLKITKNVIAVIPLTENMLSNDAYRPGDIFTSFSGHTVEIGNTDAEGRLILADALAFTDQKLKPTAIIDIATLTGACVVALGETVAAFLATDNSLAEKITKAAEKTGDKIWRLPLYKDYDDNLKSDVADINNISSERNAGAISAAVFLKTFIHNKSWAHIDIAGTAWYSKPRGYRPKNATGYGVRLLLEVIKSF